MAPMRLFYQISRIEPEQKPEAPATEPAAKPTEPLNPEPKKIELSPIPENISNEITDISVEKPEILKTPKKTTEIVKVPNDKKTPEILKTPEKVAESLKRPIESLNKTEASDKPSESSVKSVKDTNDLLKKPSDSLLKKQSESLLKKPGESLLRKPSESLTKKPGESLSKKPSESLTKKPNESLTKKPSENLVKKPSESLLKKPSENLVNKPNESMAIKPIETLSLKPIESLVKKLSENPVKKPAESLLKKQVEKKPVDEKPPEEAKTKPETEPKTEPSKTPVELKPKPPTPKPVEKPKLEIQSPVKKSPEPEKLFLNPISGEMEAQSKAKSSVQQLKTFRKEKPKSNALTISTAPIKDKQTPKEEANVSIEIKNDRKSEYDFESSSPPNRIMSLHEYTQSEIYKAKYSKMNGSMNLQDFRQQVLNGNPKEEKKDKIKEVPSLYRIQDKKPKPKDETTRVIKKPEPKLISPPKVKPELKNDPDAQADAEILRLLLKRRDSAQKAKQEKRMKMTPKAAKPVDLTKEPEKKPESKKDQAMLEMLISVAQKQSIEPLLKVPIPHGSKTQNQVSQSDINQALQFFQKLSSEMTMLEAKTQQAEQSLPPKPPSMLTLHQYYLQQIEVIRMLKRQQAMTNEVTAKLPKNDDKKQPKKEEATLKSVERTLSQIQEQAEIQRRIVAQNCKNFPPLMQYLNNAFFRDQKTPPNGQKSPLSPEEQQQLLASQQQMFSAGLTSEMSFHQMFQQYLSQQLKMNQRKPTKRPASPSPRLSSPPEKRPAISATSPKIAENNNTDKKNETTPKSLGESKASPATPGTPGTPVSVKSSTAAAST